MYLLLTPEDAKEEISLDSIDATPGAESGTRR